RYVLPWGQMSFWGATVITSLYGAIPVVGHGIVSWLWGGFAVSNPTLNRFYSLHYLFPFIIVFFVFLHVMALHTVGSNNPLGIDVKGPQDTLPFHPYYTAKDSVGVGVYLIIFAILVFFLPHQPLILDPNNAIQANPLKTPADIVPEWYFLPFYAILRSVPNKLGGVILLFGSIFVLFFLPVLDTSPVRSCRFRPIMRWLWILFVIDVLVLGYVGSNKPIGVFILMGRLATVWYFIHMLIFLPVIGKLERPLPLPDSISKSVLGGGGALPSAAAAGPMEKA
ncbi:MAG: cytochrome b, partial [Acetobacteraceae bacterium]